MTSTDRRDATDAQFADELARLDRLDVADPWRDQIADVLRAHNVWWAEDEPGVIDALAPFLKPAPGTDTSTEDALHRVLDLADEMDSHVKPRSFHPAGTHSDGASSAYADAAARIRAAVAGPQRDHDEEGDGADLATDLAERGLRACCGQPSETHCR